jgi:hypothetical protein
MPKTAEKIDHRNCPKNDGSREEVIEKRFKFKDCYEKRIRII